MFKYKPNAISVMKRLGLLWDRKAQDQIFAVFLVSGKVLEEFGKNHPDGFCNYPDLQERIFFWDRYFKERTLIEDDSIPAVYLSELDQGLYGGLLGGDVQFMNHSENGWISSMVPPILKNWEELDALCPDPSHFWFVRYIKQLQIFLNGSRDKFGISHFILINHLNLAFELVGATETYMAVIERPEMIEKAINLAYDLNTWVQDTFFENVPLVQGGTCSNMAQWISGRIVSESIDPFHMTSPDYFETWGRDPVERIFSRYDGGVLHIHGNGRHLLEVVSTVKGLKAVLLGDDKGFPPAFTILKEIQKKSADLPLVVRIDYKNFKQNLIQHKLCCGVLYEVTGTPDINSANRCMEQVRAYRN